MVPIWQLWKIWLISLHVISKIKVFAMQEGWPARGLDKHTSLHRSIIMIPIWIKNKHRKKPLRETPAGKTQATLYFHNLSNVQLCLSIRALSGIVKIDFKLPYRYHWSLNRTACHSFKTKTWEKMLGECRFLWVSRFHKSLAPWKSEYSDPSSSQWDNLLNDISLPLENHTSWLGDKH